LDKDFNLYTKVADKLGKHFAKIYDFANGEGSDIVISIPEAPKSIGHAKTQPKNLVNYEEVKEELLRITRKTVDKMKYRNMIASTVTLGLKQGTDVRGRLAAKTTNITLKSPTDDIGVIFSAVMNMLDKR
jgi:sulfatase maturation enzyme AslB (radical SAM superfamily)